MKNQNIVLLNAIITISVINFNISVLTSSNPQGTEVTDLKEDRIQKYQIKNIFTFI